MSENVSDITSKIVKITHKILMDSALGFFVTLYAVLITIFGLVWVLFLIGT